MRTRVVVTGFGALAPNGSTAEAFWKATCEGKSGIARIRSFDPTGFEVRIAADHAERPRCQTGREADFLQIFGLMHLHRIPGEQPAKISQRQPPEPAGTNGA